MSCGKSLGFFFINFLVSQLFVYNFNQSLSIGNHRSCMQLDMSNSPYCKNWQINVGCNICKRCFVVWIHWRWLLKILAANKMSSLLFPVHMQVYCFQEEEQILLILQATWMHGLLCNVDCAGTDHFRFHRQSMTEVYFCILHNYVYLKLYQNVLHYHHISRVVNF